MSIDNKAFGLNQMPTKKQVKRWLWMINCCDSEAVIIHGKNRLNMYFLNVSDAEKFVEQYKQSP